MAKSGIVIDGVPLRLGQMVTQLLGVLFIVIAFLAIILSYSLFSKFDEVPDGKNEEALLILLYISSVGIFFILAAICVYLISLLDHIERGSTSDKDSEE